MATPDSSVERERGERDFVPFKRLFREISLQTDVGLKLHKMKRTEWDQQFYAVFYELALLLDQVHEYQETLAKCCPAYDFTNTDGSHVKGNGFRSLLYVLQKLMERLLDCLQKCSRERGGVFYSVGEHLSSLTAVTRALQGMELMLKHAVILMNANPPPLLMNDTEVAEALMEVACTEDACRDAFYGRCLGFQYSQTLKPILQFLAISMASYEEWHSSNKDDPVWQLLTSIWKGSKYLQHPTKRGIKIAQVTDNPDIFFAKAFWSLTEREAIKTVVKIVSQAVDVSKDIEIPAKNIFVKNINGEEISLTPPLSDIGYKPIAATLISFKWREGQPKPLYGRKPEPLPPCKTIIFHLHGGGFVAQSSKSHESYLRWWSRELDCPIISIDYSLAPEAPFPRALEECVFAYAWMLENFETLGTTGERIIFVGDSAGGNLVITTAMKLKSHGLRLPNHIFSYYPATILRLSATPSRFLSIIDPLLPCGIMISCLQAYTGKVPDESEIERRNEIRRKLLLSKGYIILSDDTTNGGNAEQKSGSGLKGLIQKTTKSSSSKPRSGSVGGKQRPPPPNRPPLPKSMSVDTSSVTSNVSSSVSNKPKPQRPPPPKAMMSKAKSIDPESGITFSSLTNDPITDPMQTPAAAAEDKTSDSTDDTKPLDTELLASNDEKNTSKLTEVDLSTTTTTGVDVTDTKDMIEEGEDTLAPLLSSPPQPPSTTSTEDSTTSNNTDTGEKDARHTLNPASSVAVFFTGNDNSSSVETRLGRKKPSRREQLSEEETKALIRELLDSYKDPEITKDPFMSPSLAPDDLLKGLPPIDLIACSLDPLLDDAVTFAHRIKSIDQSVTLTVLEGISHGFLSLQGAENVVQAQLKCCKMMKNIICSKTK